MLNFVFTSMSVLRNERPNHLCIVTPCYNESVNIPLFFDEISKQLNTVEPVIDWHVIFVDDGSTDSTLVELRRLAEAHPFVHAISLSRNFGHQIALTAGLDNAEGDAIIMMDSDLQHPPALLPRMIELWREGFDVVSAVRDCTEDASFFKSRSASTFYRLFNAFSDTKLIPGAADFCLVSRRVHAALCKMPERHRFLRGMVSWIGFERATVPYTAPPRLHGESKYTATRMARFALDAVFSFSATPIRLASRLGLLTIAIAVVYQIYVFFRYFAFRDMATGWGSIVTLIMGLGGVQLLCIGLIGEYLARIFEESKGRPLYLIKEEISARKRHDTYVPASCR